MSTIMGKCCTIIDRVFQKTIKFIDCKTGKEFIDYVTTNYETPPQFAHPGDGGFENIEGTLFFWAPKSDFSIVVHECVHVVADILHDIGVPFEYNNDETIAYYMQFLICEIYENTVTL